ncbi:MAG: FG-GAP repeat domain-containing protein [Myxococcota bacterium]
MGRSGLWLVGLAGCMAGTLSGRPDSNDPTDGGTDGGVNGDPTCSVVESEAQELDVDRSCAPDGGEPIAAPWDVVEGWSWRGAWWDPASVNVFTPPLVGRVTDDNFDGKVTEDDPPDVAFIAFDLDFEDQEGGRGRLWLLDGSTGDEHWSFDDVYPLGGLVMADVTGDGRNELVTYDLDRRVIAVSHDGELVWRSSTKAAVQIPMITVADLDGNGVVDVIADTYRLSGLDGSLINRLNVSSALSYRMPAIADVDLDGQQEVLLGDTLLNADGTRAWQKVGFTGSWGHWGAIFEADEDPFAEVAMVADGRLQIMNHDGSVIVSVESGNDHPGAPCVADFDGDGEAEIAWASNNRFVLHELDGTEAWAVPVSDNSGLLATCSGFDFDGDGDMEILYNDNTAVYIMDGRSGAVLYRNPAHASTTIWEYPTIADIDDDGAAELLVASNRLNGFDGWAGVTVLEHATDEWMPAVPSWPVHDYSVTNVLESGQVPRVAEPSWQTYNVYRARPGSGRPLAIDLQATITDVCFAGCEPLDEVKVAVQVWNAGTENSAQGVAVALYTRDGERQELLGVKRLEKRVAGGWVSDTVVFEITAQQVGADGFIVRVDDDGGGGQLHVDECDEDNNEGVWEAPLCEDE